MGLLAQGGGIILKWLSQFLYAGADGCRGWQGKHGRKRPKG